MEKGKTARKLYSKDFIIRWTKFKVGERIGVYKRTCKDTPIASFLPTELGWFYAIKFVDMLENL